VERSDLSREQKVEILRRWEYDMRELQVADDESMTAKEPPGGDVGCCIERAPLAGCARGRRAFSADKTGRKLTRKRPS
jgi:hypothetical protein